MATRRWGGNMRRMRPHLWRAGVAAIAVAVVFLMVWGIVGIVRWAAPTNVGLSYAALLFALLALLSAPLANRIVRKRWKRQDFFRGVQITIGALLSALAYVFDLSGPTSIQQGIGPSRIPIFTRLNLAVLFAAVCLGILLVLVPVHQTWEENDAHPAAQALLLGLGTNAISIALVIALVIVVRGG